MVDKINNRCYGVRTDPLNDSATRREEVQVAPSRERTVKYAQQAVGNDFDF